MKIATLNARSLKDNFKFMQLEKESMRQNIDVLGLAEVRRKNENIISSKEGNIWYHTDSDGHRGVGFLTNKKYKQCISRFIGVNDRISVVILEINKNEKLAIIQVRGPTLESDTKVLEEFYEKLSATIKEMEKVKNIKILKLGT